MHSSMAQNTWRLYIQCCSAFETWWEMTLKVNSWSLVSAFSVSVHWTYPFCCVCSCLVSLCNNSYIFWGSILCLAQTIPCRCCCLSWNAKLAFRELWSLVFWRCFWGQAYCLLLERFFVIPTYRPIFEEDSVSLPSPGTPWLLDWLCFSSNALGCCCLFKSCWSQHPHSLLQ